MFQLLQPVVTLILGLALSVYGLTHSAQHYPGYTGFYALWQSLPALSSILVFGLGIVAVLSGLALVLTAAQGLRQRYRQLDHALHLPGRARHEQDYDEDERGYGYR